MTGKQQQRAGDQSINVQSGGSVTIITDGLSPADAEQIARGVVKREFEELSDRAAQIASNRAEDLVNRLMSRLATENPRGVETFDDPDVQYSLRVSQLAYARTGDSALADVLVDILIDRTRAKERTVRQISLNEALEVATKLTSDQFDALSLMWLVGMVRKEAIESVDQLVSWIEFSACRFMSMVRLMPATFQHLEYAGCVSVSIGQSSFSSITRSAYEDLFSGGFSAEELGAALATGDSTVAVQPVDEILNRATLPSLQDSERRRFAVTNKSEIGPLLARHDISVTTPQLIQLGALHSRSLIGPDDVMRQLNGRSIKIRQLAELWDGSMIKSARLTSVGIAIAHANCRRVLGINIADLSIWLNA